MNKSGLDGFSREYPDVDLIPNHGLPYVRCYVLDYQNGLAMVHTALQCIIFLFTRMLN